MYDVLIIGAGVVGCAIARELSKLNCSVAVVEANIDAAMEASAANSGIVHAGFDTVPGTLKAELNVRGNALYPQLAKELDFPFKRTGSLVVALNADEEAVLSELLERGKVNGVPKLKLLSRDEARSLEPNLSQSVTAALYAGTAGITSPYNFTFALMENAAANGVNFYFEFKVDKVEYNGSVFAVCCGQRYIQARYVINVAGVSADAVAALIGDTSFAVNGRAGEYMLFDKCDLIGMPIFPTPTAAGKGVLTAPTVDGSLFVGPTATSIDDKHDTSTTASGMSAVRAKASAMVDNIPFHRLITSFCGVRAISGDDFLIARSKVNNCFINVAGICSPGLTSAPAIAEKVASMFDGEFVPKSDFAAYRKAIVPLAGQSKARQAELIKQNPRYGKIICRCETVSEAEIVEAIARGARSVDGVKRRVRAGMGRCQGGFCLPKVLAVISRELDIPLEGVTKRGGASRIIVGDIKEDLR